MPPSTYGFLAKEDLPSEEAIITRCERVGFNVTGTTLVDESSVSVSVIAWIKYDPNVRTQDWTANALESTPAPDLQVPRGLSCFHKGRTRLHYRLHRDAVHRRCRARLKRRARSGQSCSNLDRSPGARGHPWPHWQRVYSALLSIVHSFFPDWTPVADYKNHQVPDLYAASPPHMLRFGFGYGDRALVICKFANRVSVAALFAISSLFHTWFIQVIPA